jgi:hypothetical protein
MQDYALTCQQLSIACSRDRNALSALEQTHHQGNELGQLYLVPVFHFLHRRPPFSSSSCLYVYPLLCAI